MSWCNHQVKVNMFSLHLECMCTHLNYLLLIFIINVFFCFFLINIYIINITNIWGVAPHDNLVPELILFCHKKVLLKYATSS